MAYGRIRAMFDFQGAPVQEATPSTPVSVLGLSDVPTAGDLFRLTEAERDARAAAAEARVLAQPGPAEPRAARTLEQVFQAFQEGKTRELRLVVKADVQGSLEPIVSSLKNLGTEEIQVHVLHAAAGNITENDVMLAAASDGIVLGFSVTAETAAGRAAEKEHVDIRLYDVIYRMTEDIEKALKGMLEPESRQVILGRAEVRAVFRIPKVGQIAGCRVVQGELRRNSSVRVLRGDQVVHDGQITSLRHEKEDVREIREGFECGVGVKGFSDFSVGDVLESYAVEKVPAA
jgi:translation initiation factor IF-2